MLEYLALPFMQRAIIAGLILGALLSLLGIFVVLKRMAFFSDGIAHASLAGVALGVLTNANPLYVALGASSIFAVLISWFERKTKIASDAIIGLIFTAGMATGVVLLSLKKGYQPELVSFLFGNILSLQWSELYIMAGLGLLIIIYLMFRHKQLALMILNPDIAHANNIKVSLHQTILYVIIALSVVLGMKMLGVVLVSALLIIPVSTAKIFSQSFHQLMAYSVIISEISIVLGLILSIILNLPTGAVIVLTGIAIFGLTMAGQRLKLQFFHGQTG